MGQASAGTVSRRPRQWVAHAVVLGALLAVVGCGGEDGKAELDRGAFAAKVPKAEFYIGIRVLDEGKARAYLCDGKRTGEWFNGPIKDGRLDLRSPGGARLQATLSATGAVGRVRVAGRIHSFRARAAEGPAGLYRRETKRAGKTRVTGWVVLADGRYKGIIHQTEAGQELDAEPEPAPPPPPPPAPRHRYLGNQPGADKTGWSEHLQGIAADSRYWFFTNTNRIVRFTLGHDPGDDLSDTEMNARCDREIDGVRTCPMPRKLSDLKYNHYGDAEILRGYLFIPITGDGVVPIIAAFKTSDLSYVAHQRLSDVQRPAGAATQTGGAGWLAVDPATERIWSSNSTLSGASPIFQYTVDFEALGTFGLPAGTAPKLLLKLVARGPKLQQKGVALTLQHMQGGVITPYGLYLNNGLDDQHYPPDGIGLYSLPSIAQRKSGDVGGGELLIHSCNGGPCAFNYEFHPGNTGGREEPEGITWLDTVQNTLVRPGVDGHLHAIMLDNEYTPGVNDELYFKHYEVTPP